MRSKCFFDSITRSYAPWLWSIDHAHPPQGGPKVFFLPPLRSPLSPSTSTENTTIQISDNLFCMSIQSVPTTPEITYAAWYDLMFGFRKIIQQNRELVPGMHKKQ